MSDQSGPRADGKTTRAITPSHLKREAWVYCRQSTELQKRENEGSALVQRNQGQIASAYGWPQKLIKIIDQDLGKSGSATELRYGWKEMLEAVARNQIGAIFVVDLSRLSRQVLDFEKLRILASYHDVLFVVDGRVVDPKDPNDVVMSQITAALAMYGNRQDTARKTAARLHLAQHGKIVSPLPVGWIKKSDGTYDYDPETAPIIRHAIQTFFKAGSMFRATRALRQQGVKLPGRDRKFVWREATAQRLRYFLTNPTYCGFYVYRKTISAPEKGIMANGCSFRKKLPQREWVVQPDILPPYITVEQSKKIQSILQANNFIKHDRVGDGHGLLQGVLICGICGHKLSVKYPGGKRRGHGYYCSWRSANFGETQCMSLEGPALDLAVEKQLLSVLQSPPIETLARVLAETQIAETQRLDQLKAQKERLEHQLMVAKDRYENCDPRYHLVFNHAQEEMQKAMEELGDFDLKMAREGDSKTTASKEEIEELVGLTQQVPGLWRLMTHREKKEVLRGAIEKVTVNVTPETAEGTICWAGGETTGYKIYRRRGRYNLVRELHSEGLGNKEIRERLARGETSTGQTWKITAAMVYLALQKAKLPSNRFPAQYLTAKETLKKLLAEHKDLAKIASELNRLGLTALRGKEWTPETVYSQQRKISLKESVGKALAKLIEAGLSDQEIANELNARGIQNWNRSRWLPGSILYFRRKLRREAISGEPKPSAIADNSNTPYVHPTNFQNSEEQARPSY